MHRGALLHTDSTARHSDSSESGVKPVGAEAGLGVKFAAAQPLSFVPGAGPLPQPFAHTCCAPVASLPWFQDAGVSHLPSLLCVRTGSYLSGSQGQWARAQAHFASRVGRWLCSMETINSGGMNLAALPSWWWGGGQGPVARDVGLAPKGLLSKAGPQARVTFFGGGCQATTELGTCKTERERVRSLSFFQRRGSLEGGICCLVPRGFEATPAGASGLGEGAKARTGQRCGRLTFQLLPGLIKPPQDERSGEKSTHSGISVLEDPKMAGLSQQEDTPESPQLSGSPVCSWAWCCEHGSQYSRLSSSLENLLCSQEPASQGGHTAALLASQPPWLQTLRAPPPLLPAS